MSIITYLGINFGIENLSILNSSHLILMKKPTTNQGISIVKDKQMTSTFVYEITLNGQLDNLNPQAKIESPIDYEAARTALSELYAMLKQTIRNGDYAQVYICWAGEEAEKRLGSEQLSLNLTEIPEILTEERFLITFINE